MNNFRYLLIALILVGFLSISGWTLALKQSRSRPAPLPAPDVVVTIYPLFDIVRNVAGLNQTIGLVLPPGTDPQTYQPSPDDVAKIRGANILFTAGRDIDPWANHLAEQAGIRTVVRLDQNLSLNNPASYYWLSIKNSQTITQTVASQLAAFDSARMADYQDQATNYIQKLEMLYQYGQAKSQKPLLQPVALDDKWLDFAEEFRLPINTSGPKNASVDPMGGSIDKDTYLNLMKANIDQLFN